MLFLLSFLWFYLDLLVSFIFAAIVIYIVPGLYFFMVSIYLVFILFFRSQVNRYLVSSIQWVCLYNS